MLPGRDRAAATHTDDTNAFRSSVCPLHRQRPRGEGAAAVEQIDPAFEEMRFPAARALSILFVWGWLC